MPVVVPAAGYGTRVAGLTGGSAKELLPVGDRPVLHHVLAEAEAAGAEQVVVVSRPDKHDLNDYLTTAVREERFALDLRVVHQEHGEGTGAAVLSAARVLPGGPFVVVWGDEIFPGHTRLSQLADQHAASGAACLSLVRVADEDVPRCGIAEGHREGAVLRVSRLLEKPDPAATRSRWASVGGYVVTWPLLERLRALRASTPGELGLAAALDGYCRDAELFGVPLESAWLETGSEEGYERARRALSVTGTGGAGPDRIGGGAR